MSEAQRGRVITEEHKRKLSITEVKHFQKNTKRKISEANKVKNAQTRLGKKSVMLQINENP